MGGKSSTTTSNNAPPPQFTQAYQAVNQQAQQVASTPYQNYSGQLQADFSPDQLAAFGTIENSQGIANPYINAAAQEVSNSNTPLAPTVQPYANQATAFNNEAGSTNLTGAADSGVQQASALYNSGANITPDEIAQFESPYTQSVVNATQAQFNNQNKQAQQGVMGNAASQGAFGGDREAVAEGITAGQEQLAQAPVIAGLENQGFQTALSAAEAQNQERQGAGAGILQGTQQQVAARQGQGQLQLAAAQGQNATGNQVLGANEANAWLASQGAAAYGSLGNEAQQTALQGANAQLTAGNQQQAQAQAGLNIPYEQYLAQQAYPFQTTGWLANIAEGLGGAAGGTSSTTTPGPSTGSQVAGAALTGVGILGQTGAFGANGYLTGAAADSISGPAADAVSGFVARGGAVGPGLPHHRAPGGGLGGFGLSQSGIPGGGLDAGTGVPDVSSNPIPGGSGMGTPSTTHGTQLINKNYGTTSHTTGGDSILGDILKGAGTVVAGIYGGPAGALAANAIGSQVHFASGGGLLSFPMNRTRMPGTGARGFTANDNHFPEISPPKRLAYGGVAVPDLPAGGVGMPAAAGAKFGSDGQLIAGSGTPPSAGGGIKDYLAQQAAGAHRPAPAAAPASSPQTPAAGNPPASTAHPLSPSDPSAVPTEGEVTLTPQQQLALNAFLTNYTTPVNNANARGGAIEHRDGGGGLNFDFSSAGGSYQDDEPPLPDATTSHGDDEGLPVPPIPPSHGGGMHHAVHHAAPSAGQGLPEPPVPPGGGPPPPPEAQGQGMPAAVQAPPAPQKELGTDNGQPPKHSPWGTLLAAGLGILGGNSPYAGVNIGRGGLQGLEYGQHQDQLDAQNALRLQQEKDLAEYRRGVLENTANRNDSYAQRVQEMHDIATERNQNLMAIASLRAASAAERAGAHVTQGDILNATVNSLKGQVNPDTGQPYTRLEAYQQANGLAPRLAAKGRDQDLREEALAQRGSHNSVLEDQANQRLQLRQSTFAEAVHQHGIQNDQRAQHELANNLNRASDEAIGVFRAALSSGNPIKIEDAQKVVDQVRAGNGARPAAPPALPPAQTGGAAPAVGGEKPPLSNIWGE